MGLGYVLHEYMYFNPAGENVQQRSFVQQYLYSVTASRQTKVPELGGAAYASPCPLAANGCRDPRRHLVSL